MVARQQSRRRSQAVTHIEKPVPPPSLPTQQGELIWTEMSTRHLFFKFFLFVFHLFSIFQKKNNNKKIVTLDPRRGTLDPRHGTLDPRPSTKR